MTSLAVFTDTYLPTVNGVTYTITGWRERWRQRGNRMDVVYPQVDGHDPRDGEHPVRSLPFPFYEDFSVGLPRTPRAVRDADVVHVHTPFHVGFAGYRLARRRDLPLVASYHTPTSEYTNYVAPTERVADALAGVSRRWERWFFDRADLVTAPSETAREHLRKTVGVSAPVEVLSNGVDTDRFAPVDAGPFLRRHDVDADGPLVGYTGRHGYEKRLDVLVEAAADLEAHLLVGGDGPARSDLEGRADDLGVDATFLGFLDREELPAFYSALDVFAFPSPVETQGIVALEAMACGTPVVGADAGALAETVDDGETGYHFAPGDVEDLRRQVRRALSEREALRSVCLDRRGSVSLDRIVDRLEELYGLV